MSQPADLHGTAGATRWELLGEALTAKRLWLLIAAFEGGVHPPGHGAFDREP